MCGHLLCNTASHALSLPAAAVVLLCVFMSPGPFAHSVACMQLFRELWLRLPCVYGALLYAADATSNSS